MPAPHRGGHGAVGGFGGCLSPHVLHGGVRFLSSNKSGMMGGSGARSPRWTSTARSCCSPVDVGRATKDQKGPPHLPEEQHAPWKPNPSTESRSPGGQCTKQPCKRTGILLSHETLDDPIALMAWGRKDAWDKVCVGLRSSQKCFSLQVWVTFLIHSGLHVLGCCKEHV